MDFTRTVFKYYDAAEKLNYEKQALIILKSQSVAADKNDLTTHNIRKMLDYKFELEAIRKEVSVYARLVSLYQNELLNALKEAGIKPGMPVYVPICRGSILRVWYTDEEICFYRKDNEHFA